MAQLTQQISTVTGASVISLEVNNRSSLGTGDVEEIRRALTSSLASAGIRVWQPDQAAATVRLTLSENLSNYVWVAEIHPIGTEPRVVFVSTPRPDSTVPAENAAPLTLQVTPLIAEDHPILDVAVLAQNPPRILVLGTTEIAIHELRGGRWTSLGSFPIGAPNPLPRDPRGRIVIRSEHHFDAYLPGLICHGDQTASQSISCSASEDPWPLAGEDSALSGFFSPARNFFTGALVPGIGNQKSAPAFYSAARIPKQNYMLWVFSGLNGQLEMLDGINRQTLAQTHWGSDIASLHAACRSDWQLLASSPENQGEDSLQAFAFPDREPVAVSQKINFRGNLRALWTTQAGDAAVAIYRDSQTGKYEAVQLGLTCSQ